MRIFLFSTAAILLLTSSVHAQEKVLAPVTAAPAASGGATDELTQQKRQLSGELKNTLGLCDPLLKKALGMVAEGKPEDHDKNMAMADGIKNVQSGLSEQLNLVNRATKEVSKGIFAKATSVIESSKKTLDGYKASIGGSAVPVGK